MFLVGVSKYDLGKYLCGGGRGKLTILNLRLRKGLDNMDLLDEVDDMV